jgi:hypothetical protein
MKRLAKFFGVSLLALATSLVACKTGRLPAAGTGPLVIRLLQDGGCEVRTKKLACSDVASYMRDELKLGPKIQCSIDASAAPSYESVQALLEALRGSGCKFGSVNASKS